MEYTEIAPSDEISSFVKCFWVYEGNNQNLRHTIFPNGYFELFMIFERQRLVSVFLSGLRTKPFEVEMPEGITVSAIRFKLSAAEYLLGREIGSMLDTVLYLDLDFWGLKALESLSFADRTAAITRKLTDLLRSKEIDASKLQLLESVYTPDLTVAEAAEAVQWERRKMNRYFNRQFGLSLKTFLNIVRLRSSFEQVKEGRLYPELNYYDQSHYIKEVKKYTGESPKELFKNEGDRFLQFSVNKKS